AAQADEPAAGNAEFNAHPAVAMVVHLDHLTFARAQFFDDHAHKIFGNIDGQHLHGLHELAIDSLGDDLRLANHEFISIAAHGFNKDGELKLATSHDLERICVSSLFHPQRDVGEQLFLQAIAQVSRGDVLPV